MERNLSLDALASDPAQAATLPPEARATLLAKALAVVGALAAPTSANGPAPTAPATDRVVRIKEAARLLGTSTDHLYRTWRKFPGAYLDRDGRVKFPVAAIERHVRTMSRR